MSEHEFPAELVERVARAMACHFSMNRMPHMSGDPLNRLGSQERRRLDDATEAALRALRDAGALVPDGWVAVPPLDQWPREMNVAFCDAANAWRHGGDWLLPDDIMRPTLAAAPRAGGGDE